MNYEKGFFETPEFRELLKKYEHAKTMGMHIYFGIDELADLLSYYLYADNSNEAEIILSAAKQLHPSAPEILKMEIRLLLGKGEAKEALGLFSKVQFIDTEAKLLQAEIFLALKDFKRARDMALDVIQGKETEQEQLYEALEIMLDCGFALEALFLCEKGLSISPGNRSLLEVKAECFIELQKTNEAIDIYNALLDEDPYSTFYWEQLGHIYFMIKRYGKALECFEYELTIESDIEYAVMMQGFCYYKLHDYKKSIDIFNSFKKSAQLPPLWF
jgi:tetratricopeptide (TPR) repeat protein